jgi:hypothetical protein
MSRGLGSIQLQILVALAQNALAPKMTYLYVISHEGAEPVPAYWDSLRVTLGITPELWDLARSSSARRAARSLVERGLLEVTMFPESSMYVRAGETFDTERWLMYVRLPPVRFDPEVAELEGSTIALHCRGIASALATQWQLAEKEWQSLVDDQPDPQLRERSIAEARKARPVVEDHLRQLDGLPAISPIGWAHVYTRHVAHWAYETERSSGVGP